MKTFTRFIALIATGLLAGCFFYGTANLVRTITGIGGFISMLFATYKSQ